MPPPLLGIADGFVGMEIDSFVFEAPPQPLDEDVVAPTPSSIHADLNPVVVQKPSEFLAGELAAARQKKL